jgi:uncharacterized protein
MSPDEQENTGSAGGEAKAVLIQDCQFRQSPDGLQLYVTCRTTEEEKSDLLRRIYTALQEFGIPEGENLEKGMERLEEALEKSLRVSDLVLIEGTPPVPPADGLIEWAENYFDRGFVIDEETGAVDYRKRAGKRTVESGELLATRIPPVPGQGGLDIFGKIVPPPKPHAAPLKAGQNVRHDEEKDAFYAEIEGRIRFLSPFLHVDDQLDIPGSINLETGNIRHPGAVYVHENIEADSEVIATGDVEVGGYVEDAVIRSSGVLTVQGGITGAAKKGIYAAGGIKARFIQNSCIESEGDIIVEREIAQSTIRTQGAVVVTNGRIMGGRIIAHGGIVTDQVGSDGLVATWLTAGEDYVLKQRLAEKEEKLVKRRETLEKITDKLRPFKEKGLKQLSPKLKEAVAALLQEAKKIKLSITEIEDEMNHQRKESQKKAKGVVIVRKELFPDAHFTVPPLSMTVRDHVPGPVKVQIIEGELRLLETRLSGRNAAS